MTISQFCWNKNVENAMTKQLLYMYITSCCLFVCLFVVVVVFFFVFFLGGGGGGGCWQPVHLGPGL